MRRRLSVCALRPLGDLTEDHSLPYRYWSLGEGWQAAFAVLTRLSDTERLTSFIGRSEGETSCRDGYESDRDCGSKPLGVRYGRELQDAVRDATSGEWGIFCLELCIARMPNHVRRIERVGGSAR